MKTHTMPVDPPSTRQRGTTLISLMIGLAISMIVVLATMMLFQRTSRVTGEARRDAQADAQRSARHASSSSSRRRLIILLRMRLRLSGERYSTKTLPIRWSISCCTQMASSPSASNS